MDAWIDRMTSVDHAEDGLTTVTVSPGEVLIIGVTDAYEFRQRCPEQYEALMECSAFVNYRRIEVGASSVLALLLIGHATQTR